MDMHVTFQYDKFPFLYTHFWSIGVVADIYIFMVDVFDVFIIFFSDLVLRGYRSLMIVSYRCCWSGLSRYGFMFSKGVRED